LDFYYDSDGNKLNTAQKQHHAEEDEWVLPGVFPHQFEHQQVQIDQKTNSTFACNIGCLFLPFWQNSTCYDEELNDSMKGIERVRSDREYT
jgi:hypothetical protein